jgi:hypothetical protein
MLDGTSLETSCGSQLMSCRACHYEQSSRGVGKLSTLQLSTPAPEYLFPRGSFFQRIRNESLRFALASRLRCGGLEAASETSRDRLPCCVSIGFYFRRTPREAQVPRNHQQKETNDPGLISDQEVWSAIRYLDPELDHRESDVAAASAFSAVVCIVCLVRVLLLLRGL